MADHRTAKQPQRFEPEILSRVWGSECIIASTPQYLGKILYMREHTKGGFQLHVEKDETEHLLSGEAILRFDDGHGGIAEHQMTAGESWHIPPGTPHQVEAVTDCVIVEASTPHRDDRVRLEERYHLPTGMGLPTTRVIARDQIDLG